MEIRASLFVGIIWIASFVSGKYVRIIDESHVFYGICGEVVGSTKDGQYRVRIDFADLEMILHNDQFKYIERLTLRNVMNGEIDTWFDRKKIHQQWKYKGTGWVIVQKNYCDGYSPNKYLRKKDKIDVESIIYFQEQLKGNEQKYFAQLISVGEGDDGIEHRIVEYVPGVLLRDYNGPKEKLEFFDDILNMIEIIHQYGCVHTDLGFHQFQIREYTDDLVLIDFKEFKCYDNVQFTWKDFRDIFLDLLPLKVNQRNEKVEILSHHLMDVLNKDRERHTLFNEVVIIRNDIKEEIDSDDDWPDWDDQLRQIRQQEKIDTAQQLLKDMLD